MLERREATEYVGKKSRRQPNVLEKRVETTECVGKKRETTECVGKKRETIECVRKRSGDN